MTGGQADLVVFDCDGVLVDSEILACEVQARALTSYGIPMDGPEVARRFLGMSAKDQRALLETEFGRELPDDHDSRCLAELYGLFRSRLQPVPGIGGVLSRLAAAGRPICVASSSSLERIGLALEVTGLAGVFGRHVFSSSMVSRGKPAPDLFLHAAGQMGVLPAHCIVIEDSVNGIKAGRAAGIRTIGFLAGAHCGPGHGGLLRQAGADVVCADAAELADAIG